MPLFARTFSPFQPQPTAPTRPSGCYSCKPTAVKRRLGCRPAGAASARTRVLFGPLCRGATPAPNSLPVHPHAGHGPPAHGHARVPHAARHGTCVATVSGERCACTTRHEWLSSKVANASSRRAPGCGRDEEMPLPYMPCRTGTRPPPHPPNPKSPSSRAPKLPISCSCCRLNATWNAT